MKKVGREVLTLLWLLASLSILPELYAQVTMKHGDLPIAGHVPLRAAIYNGYFEAEGIKVGVETVPAGIMPQALAGGSLQTSQADYLRVLVGRDQGFDFLILGPYGIVRQGMDDNPLVVGADSPIRTAKDLEGSKLAVVARRTVQQLYISEWMARNGADPSKVAFVELPFPNMVPALRAGHIDAAMITEPFMTLEMDRGGLRVIAFPYTDVFPKVEISGVIASEKWVRANEALVERFARAFIRGIDYVIANPDKVPEIVARYTGLKPELVARIVRPGKTHYPVDLESLQFTSDLAFKWGYIKNKQEVKKFLWRTALTRP